MHMCCHLSSVHFGMQLSSLREVGSKPFNYAQIKLRSIKHHFERCLKVCTKEKKVNKNSKENIVAYFSTPFLKNI